MRFLFIGDIVGKPGVAFARKAVPLLRAAERLDLVIANAENASNGSGIFPDAFKQLRKAGIDLITLGDHVYKRLEIVSILQTDEHACKPANFPPQAPGRDYAICQAADGTIVAAFSLLGRTFMKAVDCPFQAADRVLNDLVGKAAVVVVDMHAEATADKYLMAHYLNGRVAAVLGTHTHVPTADEQVFPGGTAFLCDVGMTGPHWSILGRRVDRVLGAAVTFVPAPFDVAEDDVRLSGAVVDVNPATGKATAIRRLQLNQAGLDALAAAALEQPPADRGSRSADQR